MTGEARYAVDRTPSGCLHACPVPATVARGRVTAVHADAVLERPGVRAVLTHENAPRLGASDDPTLLLLQDDRVPHRGWYVAVVVADTPEIAREAAEALDVDYATEDHDVLLRADHPDLYTPEEANGGHPAVRERGDFAAAFTASPVRIDATYSMSALHNHPMEPHASTARWEDGGLTVYDSSQGASTVRDVLAGLFELPRSGSRSSRPSSAAASVRRARPGPRASWRRWPPGTPAARCGSSCPAGSSRRSWGTVRPPSSACGSARPRTG